MSALRPYVADEAALAAELRAEAGLPADPEGARQIPTMGVSFALPLFYGPRAELVPNIRFFRPALPEPAPPAARGGGGAPVVLVTLGTTAGVPHRDFLRRILQGLRGAPVRVVAAVPDTDRPELAEAFPESEVLGFVALEHHLDRADLVVTHGGFGTVTNALARGVPLHLTPFHSEQFFNAERVRAIGVGAVLDWPGLLVRLPAKKRARGPG